MKKLDEENCIGNIMTNFIHKNTGLDIDFCGRLWTKILHKMIDGGYSFEGEDKALKEYREKRY